MSAYVIAQIKVHNQEEYRKYESAFIAVSEPFGVKELVATDDLEVLEGEWPRVRTIIMECSSKNRAKEWYESDQYKEIVHYRFRAAETNMILVGGFSLR
jgi:uncharacterized protein (DUF1330 family)